MNRAYGTPVLLSSSAQGIKIPCYNMNRRYASARASCQTQDLCMHSDIQTTAAQGLTNYRLSVIQATVTTGFNPLTLHEMPELVP